MGVRVGDEQSLGAADSTVAILGGTGEQGRGLAVRWAGAGLNVVIGSRDPSRAAAVAAGLSGEVAGLGNREAVRSSDLVLVAVPWSAHEATIAELAEELAGKTVIDCVNPLGFDKEGAFALPVPEGSAVQQAAALLPDSHVVGAFHHVSAVLLLDTSVERIDADVLVVGDHRPSTDRVQALASMIPGMRGVYAGRLRNAHQIEALTANLISVNRRYRAHAGVRVTDVDAH